MACMPATNIRCYFFQAQGILEQRLGFLALVIVISKSANKGGVLGQPDTNLRPWQRRKLWLCKLRNLQACKGANFRDSYHFMDFIRMSHLDMDRDSCGEPCPTSAFYLSWSKV